MQQGTAQMRVGTKAMPGSELVWSTARVPGAANPTHQVQCVLDAARARRSEPSRDARIAVRSARCAVQYSVWVAEPGSSSGVLLAAELLGAGHPTCSQQQQMVAAWRKPAVLQPPLGYHSQAPEESECKRAVRKGHAWNPNEGMGPERGGGSQPCFQNPAVRSCWHQRTNTPSHPRGREAEFSCPWGGSPAGVGFLARDQKARWLLWRQNVTALFRERLCFHQKLFFKNNKFGWQPLSASPPLFLLLFLF
jgi:hypothetical protein